MPEKKRTMNDMIVTKKTVVQKQILSAAQKVERRIEKPVERIVPKQRIIEEETFNVEEDEVVYEEDFSRKNRSGCMLWMVAIICVLALVIGVGGLFTHAEVSVVPKQFTGAVDTTINLAQSHQAGAVFFGTATKTFTNEKVVPSIGQAMNEMKATGTVKFYNSNTISKTISAKTEIVSSVGKKYTISKTFTIPPKGAKNPGQIDVVVTAVVSGVDGNNGLDDFTFSKPSKLLAGITMHSVTEIAGGASSADAMADPAAIAAATESLKTEFGNSRTLIARLSEQVPDTMIALPLTLPESSVAISLDPKHEDGVHITASQTVTIVVVSRTDIAKVIGNSLGAKDMSLTIKQFGDASIMTNNIVAGQPIPEKIQVRITGTPTVFGLLDTKTIKEKILGLSRKNTKAYVTQIPEVESYKINMRPFWRRVLPMNPSEVEVIE